MRKLLFRLLKKQPDGSYGVVGYEKHENGIIYHKELYNPLSAYKDDTDWNCIIGDFNPWYIRHKRKDQYIGIDIDGEKVFENDKMALGTRAIGVVVMDKGRWVVKYSYTNVVAHHQKNLYQLCNNDWRKDDDKITGIQGVTDDTYSK